MTSTGYIHWFKDTGDIIDDPTVCKAEPEEVCPHCGAKHSEYFCVWQEDENHLWSEVSVGCEDCVDCAEEECHVVDYWIDWELENRRNCRGTAYEY